MAFSCESCEEELLLLERLDETGALYYCSMCEAEKVIRTLEPKSNFFITQNEEDGFEISYEQEDSCRDENDLEILEIVGGERLSDEELRLQPIATMELKEQILKKQTCLKKTFLHHDHVSPVYKEQLSKEKSRRSLFLALFACFICLLGFGAISYFSWWRHQQLKKEILTHEKKAHEIQKKKNERDIENYHFSEAELIAEKFIQAETVAEAQSYIIPTTLEDFTNSWAKVSTDFTLKFDTLEYIPQSQYVVFKFKLFLPHDCIRILPVYKSFEDRYYVDWNTFVGVQSISLKRLNELELNSSALVRVKIQPDKYYNYGYYENKWRSFKLFHPNHSKPSDEWLNAFASISLARDLMSASSEGSQTLLVSIKWTGTALEILELRSRNPSLYMFKQIHEPLLITSSQ